MKNKSLNNIVVIMVDEWRHDQFGYRGHPVIKTPNIDKLAKEGNVFENTYCVSPICTPSRGSFWTGQYVMKHKCDFVTMDKHMPPEQWSCIDTLKKHGYVIGLAGKNHIFNDDYWPKYFDYWEEYTHFGKRKGAITESDQRVYDYRHEERRPEFQGETPDQGAVLMEGLIDGPMPFEKEECMTHRIAEDGIRFLREHASGDQPFFLHYSFPDPHWPNVVPEPYYSMYDPADVRLDGLEMDWASHPVAHYVQSISNGYGEYTLAERQRIAATMYGQMTFIDDAIGLFMDELKRLGLDQNTIVVFTADHGNFGGRYGLIGKTKAFYDALVRIPLVVQFPGIENGREFSANIENVDVMPTVMDYAGIPMEEAVHGESFLELLKRGSGEHRDAIFAEIGLNEDPPPVMPLGELNEYAKKRKAKDGASWFLDYTTKGRSAMLLENDWKYCRYVGDREELYHLKKDPLELENLAVLGGHEERVAEMRAALLDKMLVASTK
jgi:choline-sulfatase